MLLFLTALALQTAAPAPSLVAGAKAAAPAAEPSDIPHGAPTDDYGFTAWCRGALSGHMELYPAVKSELQKVEEEKASKEDSRYTTDAEREAATKRRTKEALDDTKLDEEQLAAGRTYLKLYTEAITAAEAASAANLRKRGEEAQDAGFRIWAAARGAEPRTKMWSWVMWELPARCETAARRLLDRSSLLAGALKPQPVVERAAPAPAAAEVAPEPEAAKLDSLRLDALRSDVPKPDPLKLSAPKPDDAKPDDAKPDDAKPAEDVALKAGEAPASTERPTDEAETRPAVVAKPPAKAAAKPAPKPPAKPPTPVVRKPRPAAKPAAAPPVDAPAASAAEASTVDAPAAPASTSDGPVSRRRSSAPADAPDAPPADPKP